MKQPKQRQSELQQKSAAAGAAYVADSQTAFVDNRESTIAQCKLADMIAHSPYAVAQRMQMARIAGAEKMAKPALQAKGLAIQQQAGRRLGVHQDPSGSLSAGGAGAPMQFKMEFDDGSAYLDAKANEKITSAPYIQVQNAAKAMERTVSVVEGIPGEGTACYTPLDAWKGRITVRALADKETNINGDTTLFNETLAATAHETQHAVDDLSKIVKFRPTSTGEGRMGPEENVLRTEWRAWAAEAAVIHQRWNAGKPISQIKEGLMYCYRSKADFASPSGTAFARTRTYLKRHGIIADPSDKQITDWIYAHEAWVTEAVLHFYSLIPESISEAWSRDDKKHGDDGGGGDGMEEVY